MIIMDFMKAYDRIDRETMYETLEVMNFNSKMVDLIKLLYFESEAIVITNYDKGERFKTYRRVCQECSLNPYLFIIVLEIMAIEMR